MISTGMKRFLSIAALTIVAGCGGDTSTKTTALATGKTTGTSGENKSGDASAKPRVRTVQPGTELKLAFICNNASNFWLIAQKGVQKAEKEFGLKVSFYQPPDPATPPKQNEYLENLVAQGFHGAAISPI